MKSMTAYARLHTQDTPVVLVWEIRSVNHRYLEVHWRLPETFRVLEGVLRDILAKKVHRGKIECTLKYQELKNTQDSYTLDFSRVESILSSAKSLEETYGVSNDLSVSNMLAFPDVLVPNSNQSEINAMDVEHSFTTALLSFITLRQNEGRAIQKMIAERIIELQKLIALARKEIKEKNQQLRAKLTNKIQCLESTFDEQRLEQEIALLLLKMDVSEEIDRLEIHAQQVLKVMEGSGAIGRKLDFIMQELNREANTFCSKSDDVSLTQIGVDMKVTIEQMREQIQNIE